MYSAFLTRATKRFSMWEKSVLLLSGGITQEFLKGKCVSGIAGAVGGKPEKIEQITQ
jgi:hypothetical protein